MTLIRGNKLTAAQQREVLATFVHRYTIENRVYWDRQHAKPTTPMPTDVEWLADHAFDITRAGHLSRRHRYAEPAYMAALA